MNTDAFPAASGPDRPDDDSARNTNVVRFPARTDNAGGVQDAVPAHVPGTEIEPAPEVVDAELVSDEDTDPTEDAIHQTAQLAVRQARELATGPGRGLAHPRVRPAGRTAVRHGYLVWQGHLSWGKRALDAVSHAPLREQVRSARAAGDPAALAEWHDRLRHARQARRDAVKALPGTLYSASKVVAVILIGLAGLLVVAGIAFQLAGIFGGWAGWWDLIGTVARVTVLLVGIGFRVGLLALIPGLLWAAWREGTRHGTPLAWAAPAEGDDERRRDLIPDEAAILSAFRNLNYPALNAKFKDGWRPRWIMYPVHDGRGWHAQLLLPEGVPVSGIVDRTEVLAHNLMREKTEVWPTQPRGQASVLDLYVLDPGSLTKPVDAWPLLTEGTTDYFRGVPVGVNAQGRPVIGRLFGTVWGAAGRMGSGKSTLLITTLLGAMLDPLVEIDVYCMAFNADYDPLKPRLRTLFKSDEPEEIPKVLDALKQLMSELSERGRKLSAAGEPKLTRKLAESDPTMRPRIVVIDECQELFVSKIGDEAAELVEKIVAKARKYGVTLIFATPVPSAASLPRAVAKVLSSRACFAIGDHQGNDAILGTGKHKAGITATTLRPMTEEADGRVDMGDIGTAMTVGFMSQDGLLRCYYVPRGDGVDKVTPVVTRAMALRDNTTGAPAIEAGPEQVDHLADIVAVLADRHGRDALVPIGEVVALLAAHNPGVYTQWTNKDLYRELPGSAQPYKTRNGTIHVNADRVRAALADDVTDDDPEDGTFDTDSDEYRQG